MATSSEPLIPTPATTADSPPPYLAAVTRESLRIIRRDFWPLIILSLVYLYPRSFTSISDPTRHYMLRSENQFPDRHHYTPGTQLALGFCFFSSLFTWSGILFYFMGLWAITEGILTNGLYGAPKMDKVSTALSLIVSYPSSTMATVSSWVYLGQIAFGISRGTEENGFDPFEHLWCLGVVMFQLHYALVIPFLVGEPGLGLMEAFRRSSTLMKGKRVLVLSMLLISGCIYMVLGFFGCWILEHQLGFYGDLSRGGWWKMVTPGFLIWVAAGSVVFMLVVLFNVVANAVLYQHCTKKSS